MTKYENRASKLYSIIKSAQGRASSAVSTSEPAFQKTTRHLVLEKQRASIKLIVDNLTKWLENYLRCHPDYRSRLKPEYFKLMNSFQSVLSGIMEDFPYLLPQSVNPILNTLNTLRLKQNTDQIFSDEPDANIMVEEITNSCLNIIEHLNLAINNLARSELITGKALGKTKGHEPKIHNYNINGIDVVVNNISRQNSNEEHAFIEKTFNEIRQVTEKLKSAGFLNKLRDLKIVINVFGMGGSIAGDFSPNTHIINMYRTDEPQQFTLCHEFGHKYYFLDMAANARNTWINKIEPYKVTHDEARRFFTDVFIKTLEDNEYNEDVAYYKPFHYPLVEKQIELQCTTPEQAKKYKTLLNIFPDHIEASKFNYIMSEIVANRMWEVYVMDEDITDYATKHPNEAFAEAFAIYVWMGPNVLPPKTRDAFIRAVSTGGVDLKYATIRADFFKKLLS